MIHVVKATGNISLAPTRNLLPSYFQAKRSIKIAHLGVFCYIVLILG